MKIDDLSDVDRAFVEMVHARCEEEGDCMLWTGATTVSGYPKISRVGRQSMVRRELASLKLGRSVRRDEFASSTCNDPLCLCWDHIRVVTVAKRRLETGAAGGYSTRTKGLRISMTRRKSAKLIGGEAAAQAIRSDPRPSHLVAPEHGVSPSMVRRIRGNKSWAPHANPFAGLGARA